MHVSRAFRRVCPLLFLAVVAVLASAAGTRAAGAGTLKNYPAGPNLVAFPPGTDFSAAGTLYTLQPGDTAYEATPAGQGTIAGFGYWATIAPANQAGYMPVTLAVGSDAPYSITAPPGSWIMVGDPSGLLPASVQGADAAYTFDPATGYQTATTLQPGQGAMVISSGGGVVTVRPLQPVAQQAPPQASAPAAAPAAFPTTYTPQTTYSPQITFGPQTPYIPQTAYSPQTVYSPQTATPVTASVGPAYSNPVFPNPLTAFSPMSVASWQATIQPPLSPLLPFYPSRPYSGPFLCPSDVVTTVALLLCGSLAANGPSALPAVAGAGTSFSTTGVTVVSNACWTGSISSSAGTNSVNGCGNASFPLSLQAVDTASTSFQLVTFGTLTVTANCGNPPATQSTQTTFIPFGSVSPGCHT